MPSVLEHLRRENKSLRKKVRELEQLVTTDGLTTVLTRYTIITLLEEEIEYAVRHKSPLSVAIGDIDHFKLFNDQHGHLAGDAVLRHTGTTLREAMRRYEKVGRYGGEEFLFVFRHTTSDEVRRAAERLRRTLARSVCYFGKNDFSITISIGAAEWNHEGASALIAKADRALYDAKQAGRNRVVLAK